MLEKPQSKTPLLDGALLKLPKVSSTHLLNIWRVLTISRNSPYVGDVL